MRSSMSWLTPGIAYVPFFPLGGFTPLQSSVLSEVAQGLGVTRMQVALAWLLQRAPNILLIPGTSSAGPFAGKPRRGRAGPARAEAIAALDGIAAHTSTA